MMREEKFGCIIEECKSEFNKSFGRYMAYRKDNSLSVHFAETPEKALDRAMKELGGRI